MPQQIYLSPPDITEEDRIGVNDVLTSGWVAPIGPHLNDFETAVAQRVRRKHALAVSSGTAALHLALRILGVQAGDAVICPTLTFAASANPICYLGAEPIFVDSEPRTWNMDPALLEKALLENDHVKAVVVVHIYGQCAEMERIVELCQAHSVALVEDAAEALGAGYRGNPAGSFGEFSFFSFNGNKIITTSGGGILLSNEASKIEQALYLSTQAREPVTHYEHKAIGYNYRMSNVLGALGLSQFADLDRRIATRRSHFEAYKDALGSANGVHFMPLADPESANYWLTCLTVDSKASGASRDELIRALKEASIEARPLWKPLHLQPIFKNKLYYGTEVAEKLFHTGLCLPSGSSMTIRDRDRVIQVIRGSLNKRSK